MPIKGLLSYSTQTTCDSDNLHHLWERFTTHGVPCASLPFCSFATHYCINYVEHTNAPSNASHERRMLHQYWTSNLIQATGIQYHLDMSIAPKSDFRLRIMLVQSHLGWNDINDDLYKADGKGGWNRIFVGDGDGFNSRGSSKQGEFNLEGSWFTKIHNTTNGAETAIHPAYSKLFEWQQKMFEHMKYL